MTVDTKNGITAIIAAGTMAALLVLSLLGIALLAIVHDGALASSALDIFKWIILTALPSSALYASVDRYVSGKTTGQALVAATAVNQTAVAQGLPPVVSLPGVVSIPPVTSNPAAGEPVSSPGGLGAVVTGQGVD